MNILENRGLCTGQVVPDESTGSLFEEGQAMQKKKPVPPPIQLRQHQIDFVLADDIRYLTVPKKDGTHLHAWFL
jgi:hypothetical protein